MILFIFISLGLIISKDFRNGVGTSLGALIVFSVVIVFGTIHFVPFTIYRSIKERSFKILLFLWKRWVLGIYTSFGDMLKLGIAYRYDELANVMGGELVEDLIGRMEDTAFGAERTTLSASIGYYEYIGIYINKFGRNLSKALNVVFNQTRHALGSWEKKLELKKIKDKNLLGNK